MCSDIPDKLIDAARAWTMEHSPKRREDAIDELLDWIASMGACPVCRTELDTHIRQRYRGIAYCGKNSCKNELEKRNDDDFREN